MKNIANMISFQIVFDIWLVTQYLLISVALPEVIYENSCVQYKR